MNGTNTPYEYKLNSLIDKLTNTMLTFDTLSKEQAEMAILETSSQIKEGESYINKMETEISTTNENELIARSPEEINEIKKKINNYKLEFSIIVQKFKLTQDNYINKKAQSIDDILNPSQDCLIEKEIKENMKNENGNDIKKVNKNESSTPQHNEGSTGHLQTTQNNLSENNVGNINGVDQNNIIGDDTFNNLRITFINKKRKIILLLVGIIILIVITILLFISVKSL